MLNKIEMLFNQAHKEQSIDKKRELYIKALKCSKTYGIKEYIADIYIGLIQIYYRKDLYSKALFYINLGQKYYKDTIYFFYFISARATVYMYNNQFYEAKKLLLCFYRQEGYTIYPEIFTQLSEIALGENKIKKAIYYTHKSLELSEEVYELEIAYINLIDLYRQYGMFDKAFYYLEKAKDLLKLENYYFLKFNILVKLRRYREAEEILEVINQDLEYLHEFENMITAISLELFKRTNNKQKFMEIFKKAKRLNKNEIAMLWLIYDHAGEFYEQRGESQKAIKYYKLSASQLERYRKNSNISIDDKLDFFRDKYHYLLTYTIFAYNIKNVNDALCFFELSKSSSLRDAIFINSLEYQDIKGYM